MGFFKKKDEIKESVETIKKAIDVYIEKKIYKKAPLTFNLHSYEGRCFPDVFFHYKGQCLQFGLEKGRPMLSDLPLFFENIEDYTEEFDAIKKINDEKKEAIKKLERDFELKAKEAKTRLKQMEKI